MSMRSLLATIKPYPIVSMTTQQNILRQLRYIREEFLDELLDVLEQTRTTPRRRWLKSHEVRRLLGISPNTLYNLRTKKKLPYSRIAGILFYDYYDVVHLLEQARQGPPAPPPRKDPRFKWKGASL